MATEQQVDAFQALCESYGVEDIEDVEQLPKVEVEDALGYVAESIRILRSSIQVPLIGFAGAPFTVASYMVEGQSSRDLKKTRQWMRRAPDISRLP